MGIEGFLAIPQELLRGGSLEQGPRLRVGGPMSPLAGSMVQTMSFLGLRIQEQPVPDKGWEHSALWWPNPWVPGLKVTKGWDVRITIWMTGRSGIRALRGQNRDLPCVWRGQGVRTYKGSSEISSKKPLPGPQPGSVLWAPTAPCTSLSPTMIPLPGLTPLLAVVVW